MALPEITTPNVGPFLASGHTIEPTPVFADVPNATGHARKRRTKTTAPRIVAVSWFLTSAQMAAVDLWFETTLGAGTAQFSAQIASQSGAGLLWYACRWIEPYTATPEKIDGDLVWVVTGQLRVDGEGTAGGPTPTTLALEVSATLRGSVGIIGDSAIALEVSVSLKTTLGPLALEIVVALTQPQSRYIAAEFFATLEGEAALVAPGVSVLTVDDASLVIAQRAYRAVQASAIDPSALAAALDILQIQVFGA